MKESEYGNDVQTVKAEYERHQKEHKIIDQVWIPTDLNFLKLIQMPKMLRYIKSSYLNTISSNPTIIIISSKSLLSAIYSVIKFVGLSVRLLEI